MKLISSKFMKIDRHTGRDVFRNVSCILQDKYMKRQKDKQLLFDELKKLSARDRDSHAENADVAQGVQQSSPFVDHEARKREAVALANRRKADLLKKLCSKEHSAKYARLHIFALSWKRQDVCETPHMPLAQYLQSGEVQ